MNKNDSCVVGLLKSKALGLENLKKQVFRTRQKRKKKSQGQSTRQADSEDINWGKCTNECRKLKIVEETGEEATRVAWKREKRKGKREKMPPAATDSSAEELSGIFMKKRHASQDAELRPLHDSLAYTHSGVKQPAPLQLLCACAESVCVCN